VLLFSVASGGKLLFTDRFPLAAIRCSIKRSADRPNGSPALAPQYRMCGSEQTRA